MPHHTPAPIIAPTKLKMQPSMNLPAPFARLPATAAVPLDRLDFAGLPPSAAGLGAGVSTGSGRSMAATLFASDTRSSSIDGPCGSGSGASGRMVNASLHLGHLTFFPAAVAGTASLALQDVQWTVIRSDCGTGILAFSRVPGAGATRVHIPAVMGHCTAGQRWLQEKNRAMEVSISIS